MKKYLFIIFFSLLSLLACEATDLEGVEQIRATETLASYLVEGSFFL